MKKALMLILLLAGSLCGYAQIDHVYFDKLNTNKGLPESLVRSVVEDTEGYMWIATQNGLVRYDGYNYKIYQLGSDKLNLTSVTNVFSIVGDDKHKTIWVSVAGNGLFRYNRAKDSFEQFKNPSSKYFQYLTIKAIDGDGNVWGNINDDHISKVVRFDIATKKYRLFSNLDKGINYVNADNLMGISIAIDGKIWIGTSNGVYTYNGANKPLKGYLVATDTSKMLGANPVYQAPSQPGYLWLNLFHGNNYNLRVSCLDTKTGRIVKEYHQSGRQDSLADAGIFSIYEDKKKRLWFTAAKTLSMLDRRADKFTNYRIGDSVISDLSRIVETKEGKFWLSMRTNLLYFDPESGKYHVYKSRTGSSGLTSENINVKILDHTNTLWLGLGYGGVNKISKIKSAFEVLKKDPDKPGDYPGGSAVVLSSKKDNTLLYTAKGIFSWNTSTQKFRNVYSVEAGNRINEVCADDDVLYLATLNGFVVYNTASGKMETYRNKPTDTASVTDNEIKKVYKDHTGLIWLSIGGDRGLCTFNPETKKITRYPYQTNFENLTISNNGALDDGRVICFYRDRNNTLWVGTNAGSLNRFDRSTGKFFTYYSKRNEKMSCVSSIYEDSKGRFWVGTYLTGLFEFDRSKGAYTRQLTEKNGLLYNSIVTIKEDSAGKIWVGTERGLTRIDPKTMRLRNYRSADILPGEYISDFDLNSLADGRFALTIRGGIAFFDPKDLDDDKITPIVHLETVKYNKPGANDSLAKTVLRYGLDELKLDYDQNSVQFNFIALHYEDPANNTYAYKLEGYDKQWVYCGTNRTVTYNNLPPGSYTFKVKAANSSGVWNEVGDSLIVTITPPWWTTWWAVLIYILLVAAAIYYYIQYRSRHLKYENQLLEEKVAERTDELQNVNKELQEQREEVIAQRDQLANTLDELKNTQQQLIQSEKLASLGELTAGIAHEIQNPLNFVNNFSEVSMELAVEMKQELQSGSKEEAIALADDIELNLEKIIHHGKRAEGIVKNMLQHSRANSGEKQLTDINKLVDEYLRLSYHGLRAKDKSFNAEMRTDFDGEMPKLLVIPQDIGRVMLNLFNNAFYAVQQRQKQSATDYKPIVEVATTHFTPPKGPGEVRIYVKDNGTGIPDDIREKILQPFFTTKPTGEGTGLGLSLSYDIVVKGHGGKMDMISKEGEYTEFTIHLPM